MAEKEKKFWTRLLLVFCLMVALVDVVIMIDDSRARDFGLVTTSDYLQLPIFSMDDTGFAYIPDSGHLWVRFEGEATANSFSYSTRWTDAGASGSVVDSGVNGGYTYYYFIDQVADIDNDEGEGNYSGEVSIFVDGQPTFHPFTFELYDEEREAIYDKIAATLDTLQNQDNWIATSANQTLMLDTLYAIIDSIQNHDDWIAKEASVQIIRDTLELYDTRFDSLLAALSDASIGDKVWVDGSPTIRAEITAVYDSIKLYDTRFQFLIDSLQAVLDSVQIKFVNRTAFDPTSDSVIVDVSAANTAGNLVDKIAATAADSTWDELLTGATHNIATSAGRKLRELAGAYVLSAGDAQGGGATYIILAAAENYANDWYNNAQVAIVGGTGEGQVRHIHDFTGATDSITLITNNDWVTNPDATSEYVITSDVVKHVAHIMDDVIGAGTIATNAITGSEAPLLDTILAEVDTLRILNTYLSGAKTITGRDGDTDTLKFYNGVTKVMTWYLWHVGGATGDSADSVTVSVP